MQFTILSLLYTKPEGRLESISALIRGFNEKVEIYERSNISFAEMPAKEILGESSVIYLDRE